MSTTLKCPDVRKGKMVVVKVQMSLFTSDGRPRALIYDQNRTHVWEGRPDKWLVKKMGLNTKAYFNAVWNRKGCHWTIGSQAEEQAW